MAHENGSLTGSEMGAPSTHSTPVSVALGRLRLGVLLCCWLLGVSLLVQMFVWAAASFTDMRWTEVTSDALQTEVVNAIRPMQSAGSVDWGERKLGPHESLNPNWVLTKYDGVFASISRLSGGIGAMSLLALIPLVGLGVLLAASSATAGVDKAVSAFGWCLLVAMLVLPIGEVMGFPWGNGALWSYEHLTEQLDQRRVRDGENATLGFAVTIVQHVLMPVVCLVATMLVAHRFGAGVKAGLLRKENLQLDPILEKEASNVKAGSLHAGRTAAAAKIAFDGDSEQHRP